MGVELVLRDNLLQGLLPLDVNKLLEVLCLALSLQALLLWRLGSVGSHPLVLLNISFAFILSIFFEQISTVIFD